MALASAPRIERLKLATMNLPDTHPEAASSSVCPVYGHVIDHPDGAIVVDTGVGSGNAFIDEVYSPQTTALDEALTGAGVDPRSVIAVVNTHLHFDHCGQNSYFFGTTVPYFVQTAEIDRVDQDPFYTDSAWALPPAEQQRPLDGDLVIADGVRLLATPGHTLGHQSVVVDSRAGRAVIAGQAVWHLDEYVEETATPGNVEDPDLASAAIQSIRRIKALDPDIVHFSHCSPHRAAGPADGTR